VVKNARDTLNAVDTAHCVIVCPMGWQKWTETRIGNYSVEIDYLGKHPSMYLHC
jgi:hypothetical protein